MLTTDGCTLCTSPARRRTATRSASGSILLSEPGTPTSLAPWVKNSGAPHSSVLMWLPGWESTLPHGGVRAARLRPLAADPVDTGKTSTSRSKISLSLRRALSVKGSLPYGRTCPAAASATAWAICGDAPAMLSLMKARLEGVMAMVVLMSVSLGLRC